MSKTTNPSLFQVSKDTAILACAQALKETKAERQRLFDVEVKEAMLPRTVGFWWRRHTVSRTRDEAEAYVKDRDAKGWHDWKGMWYLDADKAMELSTALLVTTGDTVSLSLEDAKFVGQFTKQDTVK